VGNSIDQVWDKVSGNVAEALLVTRVRVALLEHLKRDGMSVHITVRGDVVELTGRVEERASVMLAEQVTRSLSGVREVRNRLKWSHEPESSGASRLVSSVEREVRDALLEARIKGRLLEELGRNGFAVSVGAADGVVSLSGKLPDEARRELAAKTVRGMSGVREVHNLITIGE
jgi:osmotically-inducible protein OsmY